MRNPLVSVIIPTYNSGKTINKCLQSIKNQNYKHLEIIVIDNNSKDNTKKIAFKYTHKVYNIGPERTVQKNYGIKKAKGSYLLFLDGDMSIDKKLVSDCIEKIKTNEKGAGVCIPVFDRGNSFWVKVIAFERSFYKKTSLEAARFLKKDLVKKVGLYKDIVCYEEFIVPQEISKLGYNVKLYTQYNIYHNYDDFSFFGNLKKKFYYGKSILDYKSLSSNEFSKGQTSIINRYTIFLKNKKFYKKISLALGVLTLKTLEFSAGFLGLFLSRIKFK